MKLLFFRHPTPPVEFAVSSAGSYPRPVWFRNYLKRVEGLQKDLDARVDESVLKKAQIEVLENQEKCGVDVLTEGMLLWHDFLATVAIRAGFKPNGLARYFENNLYYRIPVLEDERNLRKPVMDDFRIACGVWKKRRALKAVMSCLTAFYLSRCEKRIFEKFAELVMREVQSLFEITGDVQLDEPALVYPEACSDYFQTFVEVLDSFNFKGRLWISTYFGSVNEKIYSELVDRFDVIGLDFVEGFEDNIRCLKEFGCKSLSAGIVDGRNTKIESLEELKEEVELISEFSPKTLYLTTNTGLEFLPEIKAYEKMSLLSKLKGMLL